MILPKLSNYEDLITSKEATTQGFIAQAREKIELATPYIESAIKFQRNSLLYLT